MLSCFTLGLEKAWMSWATYVRFGVPEDTHDYIKDIERETKKAMSLARHRITQGILTSQTQDEAKMWEDIRKNCKQIGVLLRKIGHEREKEFWRANPRP